jgi:hypothetical protein
MLIAGTVRISWSDWEHQTGETKTFAVRRLSDPSPPQPSRILAPAFSTRPGASPGWGQRHYLGHPSVKATDEGGKPRLSRICDGAAGEFFTPGAARHRQAFVIINAYRRDLDFHFRRSPRQCLRNSLRTHNRQGSSPTAGFMHPERFTSAGSFIRALHRSFPRLELPGRNLFSASLVRAVDADSSEEDA